MNTRLFVCTCALAVLVCGTLESFGTCPDPHAAYTIQGTYTYYDSTDLKWYVGYGTEITIDSFPPGDPSLDVDCTGYNLINGLRKFEWNFGDGTSYWETYGNHTDGVFDGITKHTYNGWRTTTLYLSVYDNDGDCTGCSSDNSDEFQKNVIVVAVNLIVNGVADGDEVDPGGYVIANVDDDNGNGEEDRNDSGTVSGENNLLRIDFSVSPTLSEGELKLEITEGETKIKVWDSPTKGNQIIPNGSPPNYHKTWDISSYPTPLYVEGISYTSPQDVELVLSYRRNSSTIHSDTAKLTVTATNVAYIGGDDFQDGTSESGIWLRNGYFMKGYMLRLQSPPIKSGTSVT